MAKMAREPNPINSYFRGDIVENNSTQSLDFCHVAFTWVFIHEIWAREGHTELKKKKDSHRNTKMKCTEVRFPFPFVLLRYNPTSSSELLGSSINQCLYKIPAGAKGQRRKLAAVFSSPFMLAAGLIAKCAISLVSTLKQTPRQAGEELLPHSYILWHWIFFWRGCAGERETCIYLELCLVFFCLFLFHIVFRCWRANSGVCPSHTALLTHFSRDSEAAVIGGLLAWWTLSTVVWQSLLSSCPTVRAVREFYLYFRLESFTAEGILHCVSDDSVLYC